VGGEIFFDTSVLVAASERSHPHRAQAWPALRRVANGADQGFMSVHSIAETYAALTRLPVSDDVTESVASGAGCNVERAASCRTYYFGRFPRRVLFAPALRTDLR
jgi:predicted nucleic acid-binding protein